MNWDHEYIRAWEEGPKVKFEARFFRLDGTKEFVQRWEENVADDGTVNQRIREFLEQLEQIDDSGGLNRITYQKGDKADLTPPEPPQPTKEQLAAEMYYQVRNRLADITKYEQMGLVHPNADEKEALQAYEQANQALYREPAIDLAVKL